MSPDEFITNAIEVGQTLGISALDKTQRIVWLISEAEVCSDMNGVDSFLDRYSPRWLSDVSAAFSAVGASDITRAFDQFASGDQSDQLLATLNRLITTRFGYQYESIRDLVSLHLATDRN